MFKKIMSLFVKKEKKIRLHLRFVSWPEAETLIAKGWTIAKEEDENKVIGMVYVELLIKPESK